MNILCSFVILSVQGNELYCVLLGNNVDRLQLWRPLLWQQSQRKINRDDTFFLGRFLDYFVMTHFLGKRGWHGWARESWKLGMRFMVNCSDWTNSWVIDFWKLEDIKNIFCVMKLQQLPTTEDDEEGHYTILVGSLPSSSNQNWFWFRMMFGKKVSWKNNTARARSRTYN